jgi:hypothetical protein
MSDKSAITKLGLLKLNVANKQRESGGREYDEFFAEIDKTLAHVKAYQVPKFKFLWGIEITPVTRTTVVTFITGSFSALSISML